MYKLLVVDDNADTRNTLCNSFPWDQVSFEIVKQASNGQDALQYILAHPVDAVLCDIRMPKMSGLELSKELYERQISVHVIILSAYREFEYAREAMQYGVRQYLIKPAKYQEVMKVFTELKQLMDKEHTAVPGTAGQAECPVPLLLMNHKDPIIQKIVHYVIQHYRTVKLEHAAGTVHMNPTYLSTYFKKMTGMNFSEFVLTYKMEMAAALLNDERQWKTFEVSEMVGYANVKNFIRTFKEYYGKTPGQYRRT